MVKNQRTEDQDPHTYTEDKKNDIFVPTLIARVQRLCYNKLLTLPGLNYIVVTQSSPRTTNIRPCVWL